MAFDILGLILGAIVIIAAIIVVVFIVIYNGLVVKRNNINNAWSQIDVQLKKRFDLIPNLVETVKAYAKHEKSVLENVTKARTSFMNAGTMQEKAKSADLLTGALKSLFAVAENYPQLRANENFLLLQEELSAVESKIAYARQFYNDTTLSYNNSIQVIPSNIVAMVFGFREKEYFKILQQEKEVVKVGELMNK